MKIYGIKNCDTMKKAFNWLDKKGIEYTFVNYKTQPLTEQLFFTWLKKLPIEKLINTKGTTYKNLTEEDKNLLLNNQTAFTVINKSNSVLKRPIIEKSNLLLVGFDEKEWSELV